MSDYSFRVANVSFPWLEPPDSDDAVYKRRAVKVHFDSGDSLVTEINGTKEEVDNYYLGRVFERSNEKSHKVVKVEHLAFQVGTDEEPPATATCFETRVGRKKIYGIEEVPGVVTVRADCDIFDMCEFTITTDQARVVFSDTRRQDGVSVQELMPGLDKSLRDVFILGQTPAEYVQLTTFKGCGKKPGKLPGYAHYKPHRERF